jgi:hypothetical protein
MSELYYAEMEAARNEAEDAYFKPRLHLGTDKDRILFRAGYERAFQKLWRGGDGKQPEESRIMQDFRAARKLLEEYEQSHTITENERGPLNRFVAWMDGAPSTKEELLTIPDFLRNQDNLRAERAAGETTPPGEPLASQLQRLLSDDSYAASFQSIGQYRAALSSAIRSIAAGAARVTKSSVEKTEKLCPCDAPYRQDYECMGESLSIDYKCRRTAAETVTVPVLPISEEDERIVDALVKRRLGHETLPPLETLPCGCQPARTAKWIRRECGCLPPDRDVRGDPTETV